MKTLKFASNLVPLVLSGEKTSTWRLFDDKDLRTGDQLIFVDKTTGKEFAVAEITLTREKRLSEIEEGDYARHERFASKEEMLSACRKYYGDKVDWNTIAKIIEFKLVTK